MPNYSLVVNSQFKNRSFEDLLKPLAMYTQEYNAIEDAANDLATKASVWEGMANEETDPIAYAQYKRYADDLQQQAINLSHNGLNPTSRRQLLNLKRRYASEITPIEQAYANRKAQADEQRKALLQNPTLLLSRRADTTSLDDYMRNPQLGYDSYSGALLTQQVGTAAATIAKELRDSIRKGRLDGFTKTWIEDHGFKAAEVAQAINHPDDPKSSEILNTIVNNVMADSGIANWADRATLNQAYDYARQGLWQAVGQSQVHTYTDEAAKLAAQEASQKRIAKYAADLQNQGNIPTGVNPQFDTRNVRTDKDIEQLRKDKENWNNYKQYFYKDPNTGSWKMTSKGRELYDFAQKYSGNIPGEKQGSKMINPFPEITSAQNAINMSGNNRTPAAERGAKQFMEFVDKLGISEMAKNRTGKYQSGILDAFENRTRDMLDTHAAIEYTRRIGSTNYDNVVSILNEHAVDGKLPNYERVRNDKGYGYSSKSDVDVTKLQTSDIKSAQVIYGDHGDFLEVKLKDGATLMQPFGVLSPTYNAVVQGNKGTLSKYLQAAQRGIKAIEVRPGVVLSINDLINSELNSYGSNLLSALHFDEIQPAKVESGYYGTR